MEWGVHMEQPGDTGVVGAPDRRLHNEKSHLFTPLCLTDVLIFNGHGNKIKTRKQWLRDVTLSNEQGSPNPSTDCHHTSPLACQPCLK